jgi:hypothetical protein
LLWGEPGRPAAGFGFSAAGVEPIAVRVPAKTVPRRLKPNSSSSDCGTAEVGFIFSDCGTAEVGFIFSDCGTAEVGFIFSDCGTAEAVPFQRIDFFAEL